VRIEQELRARLKGQPIPPKADNAQTAFSRITGSAQVTNGLARNDDLRAALPPPSPNSGSGAKAIVT